MTTPRQLFELQEVDLELEGKEASLAQVEKELGDDRELIEARVGVEGARESFAHLEREQRRRDDQLADLKSKISSLDKKLYGGEVTNPKELLSLQQDMEMWQKHFRQGEEELLELWEKSESATQDLNQRSHHLEEVETRWRQRRQELEQRRGELLDYISELRRKREALSQHMDALYLKIYEDLKRDRRIAVAKVEQGRCRGCQVALSLAELQRARSGFTQCSSCRRILLAE